MCNIFGSRDDIVENSILQESFLNQLLAGTGENNDGPGSLWERCFHKQDACTATLHDVVSVNELKSKAESSFCILIFNCERKLKKGHLQNTVTGVNALCMINLSSFDHPSFFYTFS